MNHLISFMVISAICLVCLQAIALLATLFMLIFCRDILAHVKQHKRAQVPFQDQLELALLDLEDKNILYRLAIVIFEPRLRRFNTARFTTQGQVAALIWELCSPLGAKRSRWLIVKAHTLGLILMSMACGATVLLPLLSVSHQLPHQFITLMQMFWPILIAQYLAGLNNLPGRWLAVPWQEAANLWYTFIQSELPPPLPAKKPRPQPEVSREKPLH